MVTMLSDGRGAHGGRTFRLLHSAASARASPEKGDRLFGVEYRLAAAPTRTAPLSACRKLQAPPLPERLRRTLEAVVGPVAAFEVLGNVLDVAHRRARAVTTGASDWRRPNEAPRSSRTTRPTGCPDNLIKNPWIARFPHAF